MNGGRTLRGLMARNSEARGKHLAPQELERREAGSRTRRQAGRDRAGCRGGTGGMVRLRRRNAISGAARSTRTGVRRGKRSSLWARCLVIVITLLWSWWWCNR